MIIALLLEYIVLILYQILTPHVIIANIADGKTKFRFD